mgnify:CR=1 FL=1
MWYGMKVYGVAGLALYKWAVLYYEKKLRERSKKGDVCLFWCFFGACLVMLRRIVGTSVRVFLLFRLMRPS